MAAVEINQWMYFSCLSKMQELYLEDRPEEEQCLFL